MRRTAKKRKNRFGASSIFLAIILSAVILVECTFLTFVWELDYITKVNNAVDAQVESIMCEYNRQLFDVYGIYAFTMTAVDDDVYRSALLACGYEEGPLLDLGGYMKIDKKALRDAINMYYSYRATGIAICQIADVFSEMIDELISEDVLKKIKEYTSSPAAGKVTEIILGAEKISSWFEKAGEKLNIKDYKKELEILESLQKKISSDDNDLEDLSFNISIKDMKPAIQLFEGLMDLHETLGKNSFLLVSHINQANYYAYNFDCSLKQDIDFTINGTAFSDIHNKNKDDSEYIMTGVTGTKALAAVNFLMLQVLTGTNFLRDYSDKEYRTKVDAVAKVISAIIAACSEGSVDIDYRIITVALIVLIATFKAGKDIQTLRKGERVSLYEKNGKKVVTAGYRDFLFLFMQAVPDELMQERALQVLRRDYGELYTGLTATCDTGIKKISISRRYALYG